MALVAVTSCGGERIRLGDAAGGNASTVAAGGAAGGAACERGRVNPNEVVWIGDSWVTIPSTQHTRVRDLAFLADALGAGDDYVILAAPAASMAAVANQYATQQAGSTPIKVLIMDGGTWDTLTAGGSQSSVAKAASGFKQLLSTVASGGTVEHIIYYLPPELPTIAGVAALRPEVVQACADSSVPCHFIDLQPLWLGHPEYTAADGIQSSEAGATVIADQIWATMVKYCIAQ